MWDLQVRDSIGRRRLEDLTPWDLERFFRTPKDQGLAKDSVRQVISEAQEQARMG